MSTATKMMICLILWVLVCMVVTLASPALAEPLDVQQRLRRWLLPHQQRPVPAIVEPAPTVPVVPPPIVRVEPQALPSVVEHVPPSVARPEPPNIAPRSVERQPSKPKPRRETRVASRHPPPDEQPSWFCSQACSYVRGKTLAQLKAAGSGYPQSTINAGKACVRRYCQDAIRF